MAPADLGAAHVRRFLSWLAVESRVSASTQSQAWNALLFLFRFALDRQIDGLAGLADPYRLMCELIYAGGLRLEECLSLRWTWTSSSRRSR